MDDKSIGQKIKMARNEAGMSQRQLADSLDLTWEMISRYENGRSSPLKNIQRIATALHKPPAYFLVENGAKYAFSAPSTYVKDNFIYSNGHSAPIIADLEELNAFINSRKYELTYSVPSWVIAKYSKLFCLRANVLIQSQLGFELGRNDICVFTRSKIEPDPNNLILIKSSEGLKLIKRVNQNISEIVAVLVYVEKRFLD